MKRILTNPRFYYILSSVIFLVGFVFYNSVNIPTDAETTSSHQLIYKCCTQLNTTLKTNLYFLKTHKTGSSTVTNIIMRFAKKYSLSVLKPKLKSYYQPFSEKSLWPDTITPDNKYNIMPYHMRYTSALKSYQYPDTIMTTILRHPTSLFQSAYLYFLMENTTKMTFEQFLKAAIKPSYLGGVNIEEVYKGYNSMSFDLGFNLKYSNNITAINEFVRKIDREFDFVMITEYMDESLVLLANLMGWPLEYVVYLPINAKHQENPYVQTEEDKLLLMELNQVDTLLYRHFLKKFLLCMRQYGEDKLKQEVLQLREMNRELRERCVAGEKIWIPLGVEQYILKNKSDAECVNATIMYLQ